MKWGEVRESPPLSIIYPLFIQYRGEVMYLWKKEMFSLVTALEKGEDEEMEEERKTRRKGDPSLSQMFYKQEI